MSAVVLRGDARALPLPDGSVDLVVTSPPYFGLRSYADGGEIYAGQIGSEYTPQSYLEALWACTREWMRVLKPGGSIFVNMGDKYSTYTGANWGNGRSLDGFRGQRKVPDGGPVNAPGVYGIPYKSLMGLPWRYALGCIDGLGLILRAEIIWNKPNPMPESAGDRVRRGHEQVFHFVRESRDYFAAVDEIREPHSAGTHPGRTRSVGNRSGAGVTHRTFAGNTDEFNPLGKPPGSVWEIASQPLSVPAALAVDHFAAFPMELPRRCILGWSPSGICTVCGEGRRPVSTTERDVTHGTGQHVSGADQVRNGAAVIGFAMRDKWQASVTITGYACACTPYSDHPERRGKDFHAGTDRAAQGMNDRNGGERYRRYVQELASPRGPIREYHLEAWAPPPMRPAVVLDPFGGTGTTSLVANMLGRTGISVDRSADYCRIARWRTTDPAERARALGVPKPPPVPDGQGNLFDPLDAAS